MNNIISSQEEELKAIYRKIRPLADKSLAAFEKIRKTADNRQLFIELAFCLLTPQSGARRCWTAIQNLLDKDLLFNGTAEEIAAAINIVRFRNNKASYIIKARKQFIEGETTLRSFLDSDIPAVGKRRWLFKEVKGYGMKEASHFLRNTGFGNEVAILDRHILRNMERLGLIEKIPVSISEKQYLEMEHSLSSFAAKTGIPMQYFDFVLWYKETGDIFK